MKIEESLHAYLIERKKTLSIAESCTGGALSYRLTKLPGASLYFLGSIVAYSNAMKRDLLGISKRLLDKKGAVSSEVAVAMCEGIQKITGSDCAMSVTGIAGPTGGTKDKPVGTVWGALMIDRSFHVWKMQFSGGRLKIIEKSVDALLEELFLKLKAL